MREVVSNTSPLLYLHQLGVLDLLPQLYERVLVPQAVVTELAEGARGGFDVPTPSALPWVDVESVPTASVLPLVTDLGRGEREAIALAAAHPGALLILDDGLARRHARLLGLPITGTLGVLLRGKERALVAAVTPLVHRLDELGFRLAPETRDAVIRMAGEVRSRGAAEPQNALLRVRGQRDDPRREAGVDRKTVDRYVSAADTLGLPLDAELTDAVVHAVTDRRHRDAPRA